MASRQWPQPEQDGQAYRTWSNIVENSVPKQHFSSDSRAEFDLLEDYIPLDKEESNEGFANEREASSSKKAKQLNLKRKHPINEKSPQSSSNSFNNGHWSDRECTPWKTKDYVQDATGLNEEIHDFLNYIKPRAEEDGIRRDVVERVETVIKQLWPQAKVELYGSCQTGLYLPTSDIDLVVHGKWESLPLRTLENALLEKEIADANSIRVLDKATVPIIKVTDKKTQVKLDISFNMKTGVQSADMIKSYMKQYPALPYLAFVLKQFLVNRDLNEVFSGGISSYIVVLMIISFFQHNEHKSGPQKIANLGVLLIEFFELYGRDFNYNKVGIRLDGKGSYFNKEKVLGTTAANATHLCIEDPLTPENYIGKSSFRINDVKRAFEWASGTLARGLENKIPGNESCSILGRITRVRREVIEHRERMLKLSPLTSLSSCMPSYASVATRNTGNATIRSIQDNKTDLTMRHEVKPSQCLASSSSNYTKTRDCLGERRRYNHGRLSPFSSDLKGHRNSSTTDHFKRSSKENSFETNGHWKRDRYYKEGGGKSDRRISSERTSSSSSPRSKDPEKKIHNSPNHKTSSPKRASSVTETCAMRSHRSTQSLKEIRRITERSLC